MNSLKTVRPAPDATHPQQPHLIDQRIEQGSDQPAQQATSLIANHLSLTLDGNSILQHICFQMADHGMNCLIGPSGAGKSSLLRCINQLHTDWQGELLLMGRDARLWPGGDDAMRRAIGLIAQKPALFPCSISQNVLFGLNRAARKLASAESIEQVLRQAALWDEVKDRLHDDALTLSVGQQQRLCIARALALQPSMLLLDEPTASLDPRSKQAIETAMLELARSMPVLTVTHDIEQAKRLGGQVLFMCDGRIIEAGSSDRFFQQAERLESREFLRWSVCDCG